MSDQRIKIPRASDRHVAAVFQTIALRWGAPPVRVSVLGFGRMANVSLQEEPTGDWKALLDHDSQLIENITLVVCGLNILYVRGGQQDALNKSAVLDEIVITAGANDQTPNEDKFALVALLNEKFRAFDPKRLPGSDPVEMQSQVWAMHQSTLERLETVSEDLVRDSLDFRKKLDGQYEAKVLSNEEAVNNKLVALEAEYQRRLAEVDARGNILEEKLAAIDDRNNTHVRREIRDKMLDDVRTRINKFGVSESTEKKRRPVLYGIIFLSVIFAALLLWTASEINTVDRSAFAIGATFQNALTNTPHESKDVVDKTNLYLLWIRFTLFSLGLAGTLLYYIKWQNKWAEQHSGSEFQLQQFYIDVNRANWVIESCLEWRKETASPIPKELLASITSGLFVNNQQEPERVLHPADELASALMGSASKLNLRVGDSELEFNKPKKIPNAVIGTGTQGR
ncbi:MAG: hypothetical protein Q8S10_10765 [Thiobacillus sp.]|nr:hypothetical protein [Thiobacillus sp.]